VRKLIVTTLALMSAGVAVAGPVTKGWYADPEIHRFGGQYWIYPTTSEAPANAPAPRLSAAQEAMRAKPDIRPAFLTQTYMDAFSSPDLKHWTKHPRIIDTGSISWAAYALWAPSVIAANGRYYMFFGANDVHPGETGGIGVAVSNRPGGPFRDAIGRPLIGTVENGAQPIDPMAFRDDDGRVYLFYGGWRHLNVVRLSPDLRSVEHFPDGSIFKELTPPGYVEGSFVVKRNGTYYLMWSEGEWTGSDYRVAYATGPTVLGPFTPRGIILQQDERIARGAGHHSVVKEPGSDRWWIAYHRRPIDDRAGDHRVLAVDRMFFNPDGTIRPVTMTP
jgi:beta-xylosidase